MTVKHRLQDMTWVEFRDRMRERPVILLPFGAQEEQGPNAPMGDFMLADRLADMIARKSGAIMAPTMPFGDSEFFRSMPGCVSLRPETFVALVYDMCRSFLDHGLDHLVIFNGQTSNAPLLDQATRKLRRDCGVMIPCLHIWRLMPADRWSALLGPNAGKTTTGHGGDPLTSIFLHFFPELVRQDLVPNERRKWKQAIGLPTRSVSSVDFKGAAVSLPLEINDMVDDGVLSGDSRYSSAEIGRGIADYLVNYTAEFIAHFRTADTRAAKS